MIDLIIFLASAQPEEVFAREKKKKINDKINK